MNPSVQHVGPSDEPDRYRLGEPIGADSEGILYRGSVGGTRDVAVKMLHPRFGRRAAAWHEPWKDQVARLRAVRAPGVARIRDGFVGALPHSPGMRRAGGATTLYLVTEWVDGEPFDDWLMANRDLPPVERLAVLVPVAAALDLLHAGAGGQPVVHGDLKPANVLVRPSGASVIVDLGVARWLPVARQELAPPGTPGYVAPEVKAGSAPDPAADRYAMGALAHLVLTGVAPPGDDRGVSIRRLGAVPGVTPELVEDLLAMLARDPNARPSPLLAWTVRLCQAAGAQAPAGIDADPAEASPVPTVPEVAPPASHRASARRPLLVAAVLALVLGAAGLAGGAMLGDDGGRTPSDVSVLSEVLCLNEQLGYVVTEPEGLAPTAGSALVGDCSAFGPGSPAPAAGSALLTETIVIGSLPGSWTSLPPFTEKETVPPAPAAVGGRAAVVLEHEVVNPVTVEGGPAVAAGSRVVTYVVDHEPGALALQLLTPPGDANHAALRQALERLAASVQLRDGMCPGDSDPRCGRPSFSSAPSILEQVRRRDG